MPQWMTDTLAAILGYEAMNHRAPTVRDLMELLGLRSTSAMQWRLDQLQKLGKIKREGRLARAIKAVME